MISFIRFLFINLFSKFLIKNYFLNLSFLLTFMFSISAHGTDEKLLKLLRQATRGIPAHSVVTWSRAPFEMALQRKISGREIGEAMVSLGFRPIDQYLPIPVVWSAAFNLECVLQFAKDTPSDVPIYSLTDVYERKSGVLNIHGAELRVWEALGRKIVWGPVATNRNLKNIQQQYLEPVHVPMVRNRLGQIPAIQSVLPTGPVSYKLPESPIYWQLVSDMGDEIEQWYDGEKKTQVKEELKQVLTHQTAEIAGLKFIGDIWPPIEVAGQGPLPDLELVEPPLDLVDHPHGIVDLDTYLARRLGHNLVELLKNNKISVKVFASLETALPADSYFEIPSIYARRGIRKFFSSKTNTLVIQMPPIQEFAQHFAAMLKLAGGTDVKVWLNQKSRDYYRRNTKYRLAEAWAKLEVSNPHVLLNGNPWLKRNLNSNKSIWQIEDTKAVLTSEYGITLEAIKIRHKSTGLKTTVVVVSSMQYRWGEGAAFLAEAFLQLGVKSITTSGFVGGPGIGKPNDISIPAQFFLNDEKINVQNFISKKNLGVEGQPKLETIFHFDTNHSHSFSPAEQTRKYVTDYIDKGYETVDVEQTLVAQKVSNHNAKEGLAVAFGSIGLITDVPRSNRSNIESIEGLDHVDQTQRIKSIADASIVYEHAILNLESQVHGGDTEKKGRIPGIEKGLNRNGYGQRCSQIFSGI